jgi:hypothetical protein
MKKFFAIIIITFLFVNKTRACEICGCGHSSFQIGLLPTFNKGFLGFRYSYSRFSSRMKNEPSQFSNDYYQSMELWGGYNYKRIQTMVFLPYVLSTKRSDDGVVYSNGIGDAMLLMNYKIFDFTRLSKNESTTMKNQLYAGGGIKLPTGVSRVNVNDPEFNIGDFNSQAGTGSVDYMLNATHNLMFNNSGVITNVAYRINTANNEHYRFGNRTYLSSMYYYTITKNTLRIKPSAGVNYQSNTVNKFRGENVADSQGYNFNATLGINLLYKKFGVNAMGFIPVAQNNYDGQTQLKTKFLVGVTFSI